MSKPDQKQYTPVQYSKQRYYTLEEISKHNTANDCWIILFGEVYDLTKLIQKNIESSSIIYYRSINIGFN